MKRLLIAYDGSEQARAAVENLARAGLPSDLETLVLSVADVWLPKDGPAISDTSLPSLKNSYNQARSAVALARELAEEAAGMLRERFPSWNVQAEACADSPPWAVVQKAGNWNADMVLVGAHSQSMFQRFFLGSVAGKVAAEAPCAVRIARDGAGGNRSGEPVRLMVGIDGSEDCVRAVRAVGSRRWPANTVCHLVTVLDPKLKTASAYPEHSKGDALDDPQAWADRWMETLSGELQQAQSNLDVQTYVLEGDPKKVLLTQADREDVDCLFLGARGLHHGDRLYLGTLANALATRAACTVEIVREKRAPAI